MTILIKEAFHSVTVTGGLETLMKGNVIRAHQTKTLLKWTKLGQPQERASDDPSNQETHPYFKQ
jgi:hypothetical protein